jgi:hypothetical protein
MSTLLNPLRTGFRVTSASMRSKWDSRVVVLWGPSWRGRRSFGDRAKGQPGVHQTPIVHDLWLKRELGRYSEGEASHSPVPRPPSFSRLCVSYPFTKDDLLRER